MRGSTTPSRWTRHFFYRSERTRTTWKLRLGAAVVVAGALWLTSGWWTAAVGRSLVCDATAAPSDAILVENFNPDYLLFERAEELRRAGLSRRVLVPIRTTNESRTLLSDVSLGIAEVMARISRVGRFEPIPIREVEPITLNAARDIERYLVREGIRSIIVVTPLFRSRRSALVYESTIGRAGIAVRCQPVEGLQDPTTWSRDWHGMQRVAEESAKLLYYHLFVLPRL